MPPATDDLEPLPLPTSSAWAALGLRVGQALHGGRQSRVVRAERDGNQLVVKLTDGRLVDPFHVRRVHVMEELAGLNPSVVGPVRIDSSLVLSIEGWHAVAYPFIDGTRLDIADRADVARMGSTLAALHESLARIDRRDLPAVAALRDGERPTDGLFGKDQLLHGDFSDANLLFDGNRVHVFDCDDCGGGPIEFDVGNSLYMVLFDATLGGLVDRYLHFRRWFVDAYETAAGISLDGRALDAAIRLRTAALGRWLDDLEHAPIGIRTATPEWRGRLRDFVESVDGV